MFPGWRKGKPLARGRGCGGRKCSPWAGSSGGPVSISVWMEGRGLGPSRGSMEHRALMTSRRLPLGRGPRAKVVMTGRRGTFDLKFHKKDTSDLDME